MNEQTQAVLGLLLRHGLTTVGGFLIAHGYMQSSDMAQFIGGGIVLAGALLSWWQKKGQAQVADLLKKLTTKTAAQAANVSTAAAVEVAKDLPAGSAITPGLPIAAVPPARSA